MDRFTDQETQQHYRELDASRQLWRDRYYRSQRELVDEVERGIRWTIVALVIGALVGGLFTASYMNEAAQAATAGLLK